jgi:hypothetical protein
MSALFQSQCHEKFFTETKNFNLTNRKYFLGCKMRPDEFKTTLSANEHSLPTGIFCDFGVSILQS